MEEVLDLNVHDGQTPHPSIRSDEIGHEARGRPAQHLGRGVVLLEDTALGEDGDPITEGCRFLDVVGHEDDGLLEPGLQVDELLLEALPGHGVDGAEGLVHEQHRRIPAECPSHPDALALAAGQLVGESTPVASGVETDQLEQLTNPGVHPGLVPPEEAGDGGDVVGHAPVGEQTTLLDHIADPTPQLHRVHFEDIGPVDQDPAHSRAQ